VITAPDIVTWLLEGEDWVSQILGEASVHRPRRGKVWVATFTGPSVGQVWKSTGTTDHAAALAIAREFEAIARAQRAKLGGARARRRIYSRQSQRSSGGGLTQAEVAVFLRISERAVRAIERRAIRKLAQHPELQALWRQYLAGELSEDRHNLSEAEIEALLGLARSQAELETILRVLEIVQGDSPSVVKLRGQFGFRARCPARCE
jgi:hypothetical protein